MQELLETGHRQADASRRLTRSESSLSLCHVALTAFLQSQLMSEGEHALPHTSTDAQEGALWQWSGGRGARP